MSLDITAGESGILRPSSPFELRHASTHRALLVNVPSRRLLAINGSGPRDAADFRLATTVLRTVAALVRGSVVRDRLGDPVRSVLEVAWAIDPALGVEDVVERLSGRTARWRQMIELPLRATEAMAAEAIDGARRGAGRNLPLVRLIHVVEGPAVQILRLGDDDELTSIRKLYAFIDEWRFSPSGDLHELVVADRAVVGQARARSILRLPIAAG